MIRVKSGSPFIVTHLSLYQLVRQRFIKDESSQYEMISVLKILSNEIHTKSLFGNKMNKNPVYQYVMRVQLISVYTAEVSARLMGSLEAYT